MPLRIDTVRSLETRQQEIAGETVQASYSQASTKAIKENILKNFGFWSKTKLGGVMDREQAAGHATLGRLGAALARKPMGAEGQGALDVLARVNAKTLGVTNALAEIGRLERQYADAHADAPGASARAFFTAARKVVLMAPMVDRQIPAKSKDAPRAIADIAIQYGRLERVFEADTLQEVDDLRSLFNWQLDAANLSGATGLAEATQMIVLVLDGKRAMLQELANATARLANGIPDAQTLQDAGEALEAMAQACLVSHGGSGELHDLGRASLVGAVQDGLKAYYGAIHRRDMARVADLQAQLDQIDFTNDLAVDWTSVDGLTDAVGAIGDKWYSQTMLGEGAAALQKLNQSAQVKSLLVRLRTLERDFAAGKGVGNAPLAAITKELGAMKVPAHEAATGQRIEAHVRALWDAMNRYAEKRALKPLEALGRELEAAKGVEEARDTGRRIEAELKAQLAFLQDPDTPVSARRLEELRGKLVKFSGAAIVKECNLVLDSIEAHRKHPERRGGHTMQALADSLARQEHLNQETLRSVQDQLKGISRRSQKATMDRLGGLEKELDSPAFRFQTHGETVFAELQTLAAVIAGARDEAARAMLAEDQGAVEAQCAKLEGMLAKMSAQAMTLLPPEQRLSLGDSGMKAMGALCRLGGFDANLALAIVKMGGGKPSALRDLSAAVNARLEGAPGATTELFAQLDALMDGEPGVAAALLQVKLGLAAGMEPRKVRLLHEAAVVRGTFDRTMAEPSRNEAMQRLGLYYFKGTTANASLRYMLGKIGVAGRGRPAGLNMAILKHLWMDALTQGMTDDSPLPDVPARFAEFQANLPEPFKSDQGLFAAMAFDAKELRFVEDFGKSLAALSTTMDGARELQEAFDACVGQDDVFAARKALEGLTRRYAACRSATGDQLMESGTVVRDGLFAACGKLPGELASAFRIAGEPTEEQKQAMADFAVKAEELRGASVLLTTRARRQQAACAAIVGNVADMEKTLRAVKEVEGEAFKPGKVSGATIAVCILALQTAVKGMEEDVDTERHAPGEADRKAAAARLQVRYNLLACLRFPEGMNLSTMTSKMQLAMDDQALRLEALRRQVYSLPDDSDEGKRRLVEIAGEIERFLADGAYVEKAKAVLAYKKQGKGSAGKVWERAFKHAGLSGKRFVAERDLVFDMFPQEIAGQAVRAEMAQGRLSVAARKDFEAAKKSLEETTKAFSRQVRKTLDDAVRIAVADAFLRSDPPLGSVAALREKVAALPDQRALREAPFFRQCQATLREKLSVPDSVSTNLLIQFLSNLDDRMFQKLAKNVDPQGVQTFLMDLSAADRKPVERLLHREDTLRRTTALVAGMTEPEAMASFDLGMARGSVVPAVAGCVFSGESRREQALQAGMTIRREGPEFVVTLSPYAAGKMGRRVHEALVELENAAARGGGQFRDGLELHFENGDKCADFLADLLSGELEMASFQNCSAVDLLAWRGGSLASLRVEIAG